MITKQMINDFLTPKKMAIAGVSRNPKKFGYQVYQELLKKDFQILPINPKADKIGDAQCYKDVTSLPDGTENLYIVTPKSNTTDIVKQAIDKKIKRIWVQQMSDNPEAIQLAQNSDIELIYKKCILMFAEPVNGPHKFHRFFAKIFGRLPK
ncbi:CoA-binding protein [Bacteroidota bacterium]